MYIDGEKVDHNMLQRIIYGKHKITVEAEEYATWTRYLYVNSEKATIEIELQEEEKETVNTSEAESEEEEENEDSQSESEKLEKEKEEVLEKYYTTLTDMIESMT